jgi:hypothetical protein
MTAVLSGTNGLLQAYDRQVLTTAFSYTFAAGTQVLIIEPAGTLATGTITMPASPADGMTITVESTQQVTALAMSGNGGTIVGPAVQLIPNQPLSWVYRLSNTTWYPLWGGAGRASALVSGTSVASTSGTSIDFTGIPSYVKRVTVILRGISTNGTSPWLIRIGTSGGFLTTGYASSAMAYGGGATGSTGLLTSGFSLTPAISAVSVFSGTMTLVNISSTFWVESFSGGYTDLAYTGCGGGTVDAGGTLDRIRITTVNGTDTFDAGTINILYE